MILTWDAVHGQTSARSSKKSKATLVAAADVGKAASAAVDSKAVDSKAAKHKKEKKHEADKAADAAEAGLARTL